jgi:membrane-associated protease RseP (regulator of RpoE activity)
MTITSTAFALLVSIAVLHFVYVIATLIAAKAFNVGIDEVSICAGPVIKKWTVGGATVSLRPLPVTAGVSFRKEPEFDELATEPRHVRYFDRLSALSKVTIALAGPLSQLILAFALIGGLAVHHLATALPDIYLGAVQPATTGVGLLKRYLEVWNESPAMAIGVLATKSVVFNLVPGVGTAGFAILAALMTGTFGWRQPTSYNIFVALPLLAPTFIPFIGWSIAIYYLFTRL